MNNTGPNFSNQYLICRITDRKPFTISVLGLLNLVNPAYWSEAEHQNSIS